MVPTAKKTTKIVPISKRYRFRVNMNLNAMGQFDYLFNSITVNRFKQKEIINDAPSGMNVNAITSRINHFLNFERAIKILIKRSNIMKYLINIMIIMQIAMN